LASVQFVGNLATDAVSAASGRHAVAEGAALDAVLVPDVSAHDEERHAWHQASQQEVQAPALAHALRVLVRLAWEAEAATAQMSAVTAHAGAEGVVPLVAGPLSVAASSFALTFAPTFAFAHLLLI